MIKLAILLFFVGAYCWHHFLSPSDPRNTQTWKVNR